MISFRALKYSWDTMLGKRYILNIGFIDMKMGKGPLLKRTFFAIYGMTGVDAFDFLDRVLRVNVSLQLRMPLNYCA